MRKTKGKITPVAFDSLGIRSMATRIGEFFIDPGISFAPKRYGLPPHSIELEMLKTLKARIVYELAKAKYVLISHFHYDHIPQPKDEILLKALSGKDVWIPDFEKMHSSARTRGKKLLRELEDHGARVHIIGKDPLPEGAEASPLVWHGAPGSRVGKVHMFLVGDVAFGSDAQGLLDPEAVREILEWNPRILIMDGFPTMFLGMRFSKEDLRRSIENVEKVISNTNVKTIIMDHHLIRDKNFKKKMQPLYDYANEVGVKLITASEYIGAEFTPLEAYRRELHKGEATDMVVKARKNLEVFRCHV